MGLHVGTCNGCNVVTLVNRFYPCGWGGHLVPGHYCADCFDRLGLAEPRKPPPSRSTENDDPQLDNARRAWEDAA